MGYVVYVNHPTSKATVHQAGCWVPQKRIADETDNGYWTNVFPTLDDAMAYACGTRKRRVKRCSFCIGSDSRR